MCSLRVPEWCEQVNLVGTVPFLFVAHVGLGIGEMKDICKDISKKAPGFYFMISKASDSDKQINFFGFVSKGVTGVDLKKLSKILEEQFGLRGGGSDSLIQGGGELDDVNKLQQVVVDWVKSC